MLLHLDQSQNTPISMINADYHHQRVTATATRTLISAEFLFCWLFIELIFLLKKRTNHRRHPTCQSIEISQKQQIRPKPELWINDYREFSLNFIIPREFSLNFIPKSSTSCFFKVFAWALCGSKSLNQWSRKAHDIANRSNIRVSVYYMTQMLTINYPLTSKHLWKRYLDSNKNITI